MINFSVLFGRCSLSMRWREACIDISSNFGRLIVIRHHLSDHWQCLECFPINVVIANLWLTKENESRFIHVSGRSSKIYIRGSQISSKQVLNRYLGYLAIIYGEGALKKGKQTAAHCPVKPAPKPAYAAVKIGANGPEAATTGMDPIAATIWQVPMHEAYVTGPQWAEWSTSIERKIAVKSLSISIGRIV